MVVKVTMYTKAQCPYCDLAKDLLKSRHVSFEEIRIDLDDSKREEMMRLSKQRSVPQIFINEQAIGGYDDLTALVKSGKFDNLLTSKKGKRSW